MNPVQAAVDRPYTVAVGVILTVLFSLLAIDRIPIQLKPTVDTPQINVTTTFRGAGAVEVEEQVTRELEEVLQNVEGLVEMTSDSVAGRSAITLEFELGTDTRLAVIDVINKLSQVPRLPDEADEPEVAIASSDENQPVMWVAARSRYEPDYIRRIIDEEVEARIQRVPGVSSLLIVGGEEREIQIRIDPEALVARGVSIDELAGAISRGSINIRGGTVETDTRQLAVRTVGKPEDYRGLAEIIVKETPGGSVRLGDLAVVVDGYREVSSRVNISGQPGVAMGIRRQVGSNVVELIRRIDAVIDGLNASFQSRGIDLTLQPVYRETTYIDAALEFVTSNLFLGAFLAVVVLLAFLRSARSVLVVALSIPISMVGVFLVLKAFDRTLNVISLAGIAFASGMVVDNAIVVLENIFRHLEEGKSPFRAAVDGGREMWGGVLASTLTTVAVFVPIILQEDEANQLFRDMALAISSAVALSLVVSLTVVPVLTHLLFRARRATPPTRERQEGEVGLGAIGSLYDRFCLLLQRRPQGAVPAKLGFVLAVLALFLASVRLAPPAEYLPTGNRNLVMFFAAPVAGTRTETAQANFLPLVEWLLSQPEADRTFAVNGGRFNGGGVVLKDEFSSAEHLAAFHQRMYGPTSMLAGFRYVVPVRASLFRDPGKQFEIEVSGPDLDVLESAAGLLQRRLEAIPGVQFVRSSLVTGNPELVVDVDEKRAKQLGLDVEDVGRTVELIVAGRRLTTLVDGGREVDVNVLAPQAAVASAEDLESVRFRTNDGKVVALGSLARVRRTTGPESIRRLERQRNVLLTVNIAPAAPLETIVDTVEQEVFPAVSRELGPEYLLGVGGSADKLRTALAALSSGFGLSCLIVYLLLVSLFRSWTTPVVILVTVPLALSGGLIGIRLASELSGGTAAFDVIAMLGFVILAGLVVNNAILIVHQANNFRDAGLAPRLALAESARSRLRPILMSVITTVAGMLPLAVGGGAGAELYQGLAAVIVGGLLVSTVFTLFLVPILLSLGHDLTEWRAGPTADGVEEKPAAEPAPEPPTEPPTAPAPEPATLDGGASDDEEATAVPSERA